MAQSNNQNLTVADILTDKEAYIISTLLKQEQHTLTEPEWAWTWLKTYFISLRYR